MPAEDESLYLDVIAKLGCWFGRLFGEERFDFDVTRCRYAEMYREMGLGHIGHLMSCNRDGAFCEGYDSNLVLTREHTIMGGAPTCTFRYRYKNSDA